jgi:hypothetical protein
VARYPFQFVFEIMCVNVVHLPLKIPVLDNILWRAADVRSSWSSISCVTEANDHVSSTCGKS